MIRAVFFDWAGTLAHPEPDRHEVIYRVAQEVEVKLPRPGLIRGVYAAESGVPEGAPPRWSEGKDEAPFIRWWDVLLAEVGVEVSRELRLERLPGA